MVAAYLVYWCVDYYVHSWEQQTIEASACQLRSIDCPASLGMVNFIENWGWILSQTAAFLASLLKLVLSIRALNNSRLQGTFGAGRRTGAST